MAKTKAQKEAEALQALAKKESGAVNPPETSESKDLAEPMPEPKKETAQEKKKRLHAELPRKMHKFL